MHVHHVGQGKHCLLSMNKPFLLPCGRSSGKYHAGAAMSFVLCCCAWLKVACLQSPRLEKGASSRMGQPLMCKVNIMRDAICLHDLGCMCNICIWMRRSCLQPALSHILHVQDDIKSGVEVVPPREPCSSGVGLTLWTVDWAIRRAVRFADQIC